MRLTKQQSLMFARCGDIWSRLLVCPCSTGIPGGLVSVIIRDGDRCPLAQCKHCVLQNSRKPQASSSSIVPGLLTDVSLQVCSGFVKVFSIKPSPAGCERSSCSVFSPALSFARFFLFTICLKGFEFTKAFESGISESFYMCQRSTSSRYKEKFSSHKCYFKYVRWIRFIGI